MIFLFFVALSSTRRRPPLGRTRVLNTAVNHTTCDVYSPKAVETLIHGQCYRYHLFSLLCVKYMFFSLYSFLFALDSKGIPNTLKKVLSQPWNSLFQFRYVRNMIRSCLPCKAISAGATVLLDLRVFFCNFRQLSANFCSVYSPNVVET